METRRTLQDLAPASLPPGTEVGSWRVLERRGRGNYGAVYRVESLEGSGPFALKLATHPMDPRFDRETELLARIRHPCVPRLHAHGLWPHPAGPFPFLVMEWVEGQPLYEWGREQCPTSRHVLRVLAQVARALEATHAVGAVHRDVKGDNVLVRMRDGQAVLTDFGAGYFRGAPTLTAPPLPPGTPPYRSPEAIRFQWGYRSHPTARYEAQPADEVFALGVTAYRLVTGSYPPPPRVDGMDDAEGEVPPLVPPRLRNPAVCAELDALILRMLAELPAQRPGRGSASAVAQVLEEAARNAGPLADVPLSHPAAPVPQADGDTPLAPPSRSPHGPTGWPWFAAAVVCMSLLSAATGWLLRPTHEPEPLSQASAPIESRDGGTVSVGDAALASPVTILAPVPTFTAPPGLSLPMPDRPFPGQRKPPCNRKGEVELRGGCWYELARVKSPCDEDAYDYKGACYLPSFPVQRAPTSSPTPRP